MIRHFFLDKTNTIIKGSKANLGLNPIAELKYGNGISRVLVHFPLSEIVSLVNDKTFYDLSKLSVRLKMVNCSTINGVPYDKKYTWGDCSSKERASSFDIFALSLPCEFDGGRGFERGDEVWVHSERSYTENGSNWYQSQNGIKWSDMNYIGASDGVYDSNKIYSDYQKFLNGEESDMVGVQHFDFGNEDIDIDVSNYVKKCITSDTNNGILLAFNPLIESGITKFEQFSTFFTDNTNTFFHPYIEVEYNENIRDDRNCFFNDAENNLYFYASTNEGYFNLDEIPICTIDDGTVCSVEQVGKGIYKARVNGKVYSHNEIHYDKWTNLKYNGEALDECEWEFVVQDKKKYNFSPFSNEKEVFTPYLSGINDDEKVNQGDIREISIDYRKRFDSSKKEVAIDAEFRLYVKDGNREIDIFDGYNPIERGFLYNYFLIYTSDLIPNTYYIDIKIKHGKEMRFFKNILSFSVVSNVTKRYVEEANN